MATSASEVIGQIHRQIAVLRIQLPSTPGPPLSSATLRATSETQLRKGEGHIAGSDGRLSVRTRPAWTPKPAVHRKKRRRRQGAGWWIAAVAAQGWSHCSRITASNTSNRMRVRAAGTGLLNRGSTECRFIQPRQPAARPLRAQPALKQS